VQPWNRINMDSRELLSQNGRGTACVTYRNEHRIRQDC
jgi:hypothetical protein